jgi:carbamoyltransferase
VTASDLDAVVSYEKPLLKFERLIETYLDIAPRGLSSFRRATPFWLKERLYVERVGALQSEGQRPEGVI